MHSILRRALLPLALVGTAVGCTDLTLEPKSAISSANIFNDEASYRSYLARIYGGLAVTGQQGAAGNADIAGIDEGFSHYLRLLWQMNELPTDEAAIAWGDGPLQELNTQIWTSTNSFLVAMYYRVFFQVGLANDFLRETTDEKLASRNASQATRDAVKRYRAEARFLRALSYWHGLDLFGAIPLVRESDPIGATPPRQATAQEVFDYIVAELQAIRGDLPAANAGVNANQADQGAVAMLLAKVYLQAGVYTGTPRWNDAATEVNRVLGASYTIDGNYRRMFSADNHTSNELIFSVEQDGTRTQSFGGTTFLMNASVGGAIDPASQGIGGGWWGLRLKPEMLAFWPGDNWGTTSTDVRSRHFFSQGQTRTMNSLTEFSNGILNPKYINRTSTGQPGSNSGHADIDYPMFRLGDAYLMYAELALRGATGTNRGQALTYVNALRQRAYGNTNGNITDAQLTLDFILDERARELNWEGHRRMDLIRFGRFTTQGVWAWKGNVLAGRTTEAFRNLYPKPASELSANPNLTQNTGY